MIAYLRGSLIYKSSLQKKDNFAVIDVGGVGYKVFSTDKFLGQLSLDQAAEVFVYTQVAEGVFDLYGFASRNELDFFELLLTISGIGPRSALDILSKAKIDDLRQAILSGNHQVLSQVSGIGPKTAEKIVLGLKDKLGVSIIGEAASWNNDFGDALEALIGLGYSSSDARNALNQTKSAAVGDKVREALKLLGRK